MAYLDLLLSDKWASLSYLMCLLSLISIFIDKKFIIPGFVLTSVLGWFSGRISVVGITALIATWIVFYLRDTSSNISVKNTLSVLSMLLVGAYFLHKIPGFDNWQIIKDHYITQDSVPFSMFLNFDKPLVCLLIAKYACGKLTTRTPPRLILIIILTTLSCIATVLGMACYIGLVEFTVKLPSIITIWIINNLFVVCVCEELLFRGWLQSAINKLLNHYFAILIVSCIFSAAHFSGGTYYCLLAGIASTHYGYVWHKTKLLPASILVHFMVNITHLIAFSYPKLA